MNIKEVIRKYSLQNAVRYNGKANPGNIIGKVLGENPELRKKGKELMQQIQEIVKEVNGLGVEKQTTELKKLAPEMLEKKAEKKKELPELKDAKKGKVVMRFEPSPSGPLHIGHAYVIGLNSEYCRRYNGKMILRIGDTNPENIYEPAYDLIPKNAKWVTKGNIAKEFTQSERLEIYYKYMEKLIDMGKSYICECDPEEFKHLSAKGKACPCRNLDIDEQKKRWKKMFDSYKQGEAVARIKTELQHKNPAMRDWPAFRINDSKHPKVGVKYRVWPLMNMAVSVDDIEMGITHVIRAKEHHDNSKRQEYIYNYLGKKPPQALFVGRINFEDMRVSCSKTRPLIEEGKYSGWDDIRLPFLDALKRRGYQPEAFIKYALDVGMSLNDKNVTKREFFKVINAFNREIIDPGSYRFFFVGRPKKVKIENAPEQEIELDLHPDNKKGGRRFKVNDEFYIDEDDFKGLREKKLYRLMDCANFTKKEGKLFFDSTEYEKYKDKGTGIIHWLPAQGNIEVEVMTDEGKKIHGLGESTMKDIKGGDIVQLERFGFCRLDKKEKNKLIFWYTHK
ncbi:glutamate--tRNA ligase [Candidatus Woesearchaeota archaeon]|nr:glutamate--tRNA ligase [Candidatus Woesearchaeota archaeon]